MTRFTVVWEQDTQGDLTEIWLEAADRNAVTRAADTVELELANDPSTKGDELREGLRALVVPPLQVLFAVREDDRVVEVFRVKLI